MERYINFEKCINFEDLPLGKKFYVKDNFTTSGTSIKVQPFQWSNYVWTSNGYAIIENNQKAGGSGYDIWTNNVNLGFRLRNLKYGLKLLFGEYGGNLNIGINGKFQNFHRFSNINGANIGGVSISIIQSWHPNQGLLILHGEMNEFKFREDRCTFIIGGQELAIDNVCLLKK